MSPFFKKLARLFPSADDDPARRQFKTNIYLVIGIIVLMVVSGLVVFLLTVEGEEQTLVPDVRNIDLAEGMIALQEKGLSAEIQLRFSSNPMDKGKILDQSPNPGTLVKVGRKITLRVSKGAVIDKVENYIGWNIDDLEIHLQPLFTAYDVLLKLKKPYIRVHDDAPAGTILQQKPLPGANISGPTDLELVVSLGPQGETVMIGEYIDRPYQDVLNRVIASGIPFAFTVRDPQRGEKAGYVVSQLPAPETYVPDGTLIQFIMTKPDKLPEGIVFGLVQKTLPDYPVPLDLRVEVILPNGDRNELYTIKHKGGLLSLPYELEENSILIVSIGDKELFRQMVRE